MATKKIEKKTGVDSNVFDIDEISELLKLLKENGVTEFSLERSGETISLRREGANSVDASTVSKAVVAPSVVAAVPQVPAQLPLQQISSPAEAAPANDTSIAPANNLSEIKSPMVGTFYTRSTPDADPYVSVGDTVKKGQVVCIIEAMKIMNEIEAEHSGRIVEVCVEDGQMAEYEETLFRIEPLG